MSVDETDLTDGLIDLFTRDAFEQIDNRYAHWPHREVRFTYATVPGTQEIPFATIDPTLEEVRSILNTSTVGYAMQLVSQEDAESWFIGAMDNTAMPVFFSITSDNTINLWPKPDSVYTLKVRGFRAAVNWLAGGAGASPDLPASFHTALVYKVISLTYAQGEDPELAALWDSYYQQAAASAETATFRASEVRPRILHGSRRRFRPGGTFGLTLDLLRR